MKLQGCCHVDCLAGGAEILSRLVPPYEPPRNLLTHWLVEPWWVGAPDTARPGHCTPWGTYTPWASHAQVAALRQQQETEAATWGARCEALRSALEAKEAHCSALEAELGTRPTQKQVGRRAGACLELNNAWSSARECFSMGGR